MKTGKNNIDWKVSGEKVCWAAVIMIMALLIVFLSSCRTHSESTVDYGITSTEDYQELRSEQQEERKAIKTTETHDTVKEVNTHTGQIEIERDTAGRAVRIIYEHVFKGVQTQGSSRIDTVCQKQIIVIRDSIGNGQKETVIDGQTKEKKDAGVGFWSVLGFGGFWLLMCIVAIFLFILVKKKWRE